MIILDTNVISALMQTNPDQHVVRWLDAQPVESIWTTSVTVFEILFGLNSLPKGKRKKALLESFQLILEMGLDGNVLEFDQTAAQEAALIAAHLKISGRPVETRDIQIAGITRARKASLATRNTRHFQDAGITLINPWES